MIRVVGTAGHVDHGKSTLVEALTGTHPDRLREEREREMTIDLGFAWMDLDDGTEVGIVDVPGHRDFIDNMLAGAGGIQAAILVIAADEGVMPQTREHLAILDLLETPRLVVALTKVDSVQDDEWTGMVEQDVRRLLGPTRHAAAPIVRVSAREKVGLEELRRSLQVELARLPAARDVGRPRLPIDRAFVMSGFGTVVTGTLVDGGLDLGSEVTVLPAGRHGRVRGLQTHRRKVEHAAAGSRVAVNLTGVDAQEVERGDVVTLAGLYAPTRRFDARIRLLADSPLVLKHGQAVKVYLGTADVVGRARLLDAEQLEPGKDGWAQIVVDQPIVAADQDRFILRRPTPAATLGGGVVVDPHPARTHRRRDARVLEALEGRGGGRPEERVLVVLSGGVPLGLAELEAGSGVDHSEIQRTLGELVAGGRAVEVSDGAQGRLWATAGWWRATTGSVEKLLQTYHEQFPLRAGMPREELRSRLGLEARTFEAVVSGLEAEGVVARRGSRLARAGYAPKLTSDQARRLEELRDRFAAAPTSPPSVKECRQAVGDELWALVTADGEFVEVSEEVVFDAATYRRIVGEISAALAGGGTITVAELRDRYQTSRKFALALLEHLDALGVTVRSGDERRLKTPQTDRSGPPAG